MTSVYAGELPDMKLLLADPLVSPDVKQCVRVFAAHHSAMLHILIAQGKTTHAAYNDLVAAQMKVLDPRKK